MTSLNWKCYFLAYIFLSACSNALVCPQGCSCDDGERIYICKSGNLRSPPNELPVLTRKLVIENSPHLHIPSNFFRKTYIRSLVLANDNINHHFELPLVNEELSLQRNRINFSTLVKFLSGNFPPRRMKFNTFESAQVLKADYEDNPVVSTPNAYRRESVPGSIFKRISFGSKWHSESLTRNLEGSILLKKNIQYPVLKRQGTFKNMNSVFINDVWKRTMALSTTKRDKEFAYPSSWNVRKTTYPKIKSWKSTANYRNQSYVFAENQLSRLRVLDIQDNDIRIVNINRPIFKKATRLIALVLSGNSIPYITEHLFSGLSRLNHLYLRKCQVQHLHSRAFQHLYRLYNLQLGENVIKRIPDVIYTSSKLGWSFNISYNNLATVPIIRSKTSWVNLDCSYNHINNLDNLRHNPVPAHTLNLRGNIISNVQLNGSDIFILDLSSNNLTRIQNDSFRLNNLKQLNLFNNSISYIHPNAFLTFSNVSCIYAHNNNISSLLTSTLPPSLERITLSGNKIKHLIEDSIDKRHQDINIFLSCGELEFLQTSYYSANKINCNKEMTAYLSSIPLTLSSSFLKSGYYCSSHFSELDFNQKQTNCISCGFGHYNNGSPTCKSCPKGGYYQDQIAQNQCKKCRPGLYSHEEAAKSKSDCQICPSGTIIDRFAKTRACYCLPSFARRRRFGYCLECNEKGIKCLNETEDLAPEYWWKWNKTSEMDKFLCFKKNLANEGEDYNTSCNSYTGHLPQVYKCPYKKACLGGMSARCQKNYTGPLCAVCNTNYYRSHLGCMKCSNKTASILKLLTVPFLILLILLLLRWMETVTIENGNKRTLADLCLSIIKILLGYYQILAVIITVLSDIAWPKIVIDFSTSCYQILLEVFFFPAVKCVHPKLEISAYVEMAVSCLIVILLPIIFLLVYYLDSCTSRLRACAFEMENETSRLKKLLLRGLFMFYFVLYPIVCQRIFQVMPFNCHKLCFDRDGRVCKYYLRADYRLECSPSNLSNYIYVYISYAALIIPIGFPLMLLMMLWYSHRQLENGNQWNIDENPVVFATRFCYENYKSDFWFWEVLEMTRKLLFTVGFAFFGLGSRANHGYMIIISGIATISYAYMKPIKYRMEHVFHMISLSCLFLTLCVSTLLRLEQKYINTIYDPNVDKIGISTIVVMLNLTPIVAFVMRVLHFLSCSIYRKLAAK